ncbi:MAG: c-type cytochrome [Planctomycetales bacterium]|nr:c-type cytochrome [Planctomycetales bacterium]
MENDALTDHSYDGIQEFDNPLPGWWKWMFVGSIVFSALYALYFHVGAPGRSVIEQYDRALSANTLLQFSEIGDLQPNEETILRFANQKSWLSVGRTVFKTNCISCHGRDGEGQVGPNLGDEFYKNVRKVEDIARVVNQGAGNGAMPAWANRLHANEVVLVSAYVASLRGTIAAGTGKGPEGSEIPPWPEPPAEPEPSAEDASTEG